MRDCVDTNSVKAIFAYKVLDPVLEVLAHIGVTLIEIRKSCKTAVFDLVLVTPVINVAVSMIVLRTVEGVN